MWDTQLRRKALGFKTSVLRRSAEVSVIMLSLIHI